MDFKALLLKVGWILSEWYEKVISVSWTDVYSSQIRF